VTTGVGGWTVEKSAAWVGTLCIAALCSCGRRSSEQLGVLRSHLEASGVSQMATWTCTDDPCPWGDELSNPALAWPPETNPVTTRLGYTVSPGVYLPASIANGLTVTIDFGSAVVHAGVPQGSSHPALAFLSAGDSFDVADLDPDEVLSVQSTDGFGYHIAPTPPADHSDAGTPDDTPDAGTPDEPDAGTPADAAPPPDAAVPPDAPIPPEGSTASQAITWTCTGHQCPFGQSFTAQALVWPVDREAVATHLGYTASEIIYLFGSRANGADIWIDTGAATLQAGLPGDFSFRTLATLHAGSSFHVAGVGFGEVLSVQSDQSFSYRILVPPPTPPAGGPPVNPGAGTLRQAIASLWRCDPGVASCFSDPWTGAIISWPGGTAFQGNARPGNLARLVYSWDGTPLYPYMGAWANGCEVTGESGITRVIEWQRGASQWRDTWLYPGESHVIHLVPPEDGALIEGYDASPGFSATVRNCTPQPLLP
jgi:hypothetical protein